MTTKLVNYLSELLIIVLGVTISLFFGELAEDFKRDEQEAYYLQSLLENLEEDGQRLGRALEFIDDVAASADLLLRSSMEMPAMDMLSPELADSQTDLLQHSIFAANTSVFEELKSTGAFIALEDKALKNAIFRYYGAIENAREDDNSANDVITRFVYPRLNDNLPLGRLAEIPGAEYGILFAAVNAPREQPRGEPSARGTTADLVNAVAIRKGINMAQRANYARLRNQNHELIDAIRQALEQN